MRRFSFLIRNAWRKWGQVKTYIVTIKKKKLKMSTKVIKEGNVTTTIMDLTNGVGGRSAEVIKIIF